MYTEDYFYQQNMASPHISKIVQDCCNDNFADFGNIKERPSSFPNLLTPSTFFDMEIYDIRTKQMQVY